MTGGFKSNRVSLAGLMLLAFALSAALPSGGFGKTQATDLLVTYVGTTSLRLSVGNSPVGSGGSVPAGSYNVLVDDADFTNPRFVMTGPGVNISSDLNSSGMGIDRPATFGPFNLDSGSSYTVRDANMGASLTFSVSAGGGSSSGGSTSGGSSSGGTSSGGSSGTKVTKTLGTLTGTVSVAGKAALTFGGRPVKTLKAGVYTLSVSDHSSKVGLVVQKLGFHAMNESGVAATGSRSTRLTLTAGKWFVQASPGGGKIYFSVS